MRKASFAVLLLLGLGGSPALLSAETSPAPQALQPASAAAPAPNGSDLYSPALQAYLAGNYDQAILLDSRALQADPQDPKAQALLSILVSEKDKANQSVIWIGKEGGTEMAAANPPVPVAAPAVVPPAQPVAPPAPVKRSPKGQSMAELEARVNAVVFLLERDSNNQYRELTGAQANVQKRLDEIGGSLRSRALLEDVLFLLALLVAAGALWKSWRNERELRHQMTFWQGHERNERGRVVPMRKM